MYSVREHISGTTCPSSTKLSMYVYPWPWLGPPLVVLEYVMYFRFIDGVIFSYCGPLGGVTLAAVCLRSKPMVYSNWVLLVLDVGGSPRLDKTFVHEAPKLNISDALLYDIVIDIKNGRSTL